MPQKCSSGGARLANISKEVSRRFQGINLRMAGNLPPETPTMDRSPTLPRLRRSKRVNPTTPTFLSDLEAPPPTNPVVYSPVPTCAVHQLMARMTPEVTSFQHSVQQPLALKRRRASDTLPRQCGVTYHQNRWWCHIAGVRCCLWISEDQLSLTSAPDKVSRREKVW
jgi:hypothetical protein